MTYKIETFNELGSTNDYIKEHPELWEHDFYTVRAINQTSGRGRQERKWFSRNKLDLTFSTMFHTKLKSDSISIITLYVGLAVHRTLKKYLGHELYIKWPNDIYYNGKKLCGILCESIIYQNKCLVIAGIGVNVNNGEFPSDLNEISTSMKIIKGEDFDIDFILDKILNQLIDIIPLITNPIKKDIIEELRNSFKHKDIEVIYYSDSIKKRGKILDINESGNIVILDSESNDQIAYSGDLIYV